jgi:hypothetical protein
MTFSWHLKKKKKLPISDLDPDPYGSDRDSQFLKLLGNVRKVRKGHRKEKKKDTECI